MTSIYVVQNIVLIIYALTVTMEVDSFKISKKLSDTSTRVLSMSSDVDQFSKISNSTFAADIPLTSRISAKSRQKLVTSGVLSAAAILSPYLLGLGTNSMKFCSCHECTGAENCITADSWYDPRNERIFDTWKRSYLPPFAGRYLKKVLSNKQIVCVGEVHSNPCHHKLQFDVVKSLAQMVPSRKLAIGLECFYRQHQSALDRYIYLHKDFAMLKRETSWDYTWGFDINYYAKMFHFAALNEIRLIGLNVPVTVAELVFRGGLDSLPTSLRQLLPEMDLNDAEHKAQFLEAIKNAGHHHQGDNSMVLQNMYEVQTLWDEYMAESASNYFKKSPPGSMLCVIAGLNHVAGRNGIPNRISRRVRPNPEPFVIVPKQVSWSDESGLPDIRSPPSVKECDWAWFTEREILRA